MVRVTGAEMNFNNDDAVVIHKKFGNLTCSSANSWFNAPVRVSNQLFALVTGAG
jgi:hypothetical protein